MWVLLSFGDSLASAASRADAESRVDMISVSVSVLPVVSETSEVLHVGSCHPRRDTVWSLAPLSRDDVLGLGESAESTSNDESARW